MLPFTARREVAGGACGLGVFGIWLSGRGEREEEEGEELFHSFKLQRFLKELFLGFIILTGDLHIVPF